MRRVLLIFASVAAMMLVFVSPARAGSPHFVGSPTVTVSGSTITVSAKEAGLGNEPQILAVLSGTAECINGGGKHPKAANKTSFSKSSVEPVQNGKANYTLSATATFVPSCSPPMTVEFTSATLSDATNGISVTLIR
jgi:type V secretory pathway adhesin AidA